MRISAPLPSCLRSCGPTPVRSRRGVARATVWEEAIANWLETRLQTKPLVTSAEVAQQALGLQLRDLDGRAVARITRCPCVWPAGARNAKGAQRHVKGVRYWAPMEGGNE